MFRKISFQLEFHLLYRYRVTTDISSRVSRLNLQWNTTHLKEEEQFNKAVAMVGEEFLYFVNNTTRTWLPARTIVKQSIQSRFEVCRKIKLPCTYR